MNQCEGEKCQVCQAWTIEGNDSLGRCIRCEHGSTLDHLLRSMAAGLTRNVRTGRIEKIGAR